MKNKILLAFSIFSIAVFALAARITTTDLQIGKGAAEDIDLTFDEGSANKPKLRWDESASRIQVSNDGVVFSDVGLPAASNTINEVNGADYTILDDDGFETISVTLGGANRTVTLPTLADNIGREIEINKADGGAFWLYLDAEGSELINGSSSATEWGVFDQYGSLSVKAETNGWYVKNQNEPVVDIKNSLSSDASCGSPAALISDLTFTGLESGVEYEIYWSIWSGGSAANMWLLYGDPNDPADYIYFTAPVGDTSNGIIRFTSDGSDVEFFCGSGGTLRKSDGNLAPTVITGGSPDVTFAVLREVSKFR